MSVLQPPPWPGWDGLHPLVVHFPIALLLVAPLFVLLGAAMPRRGRALSLSALMLLAIGTSFIFIAAETGEAAGQLVDDTPAVHNVLERHEELAELATPVFATITIAFALVLAAQWWFVKLQTPRVHVPVHVAVLLVLVGATLLLANTAHQGGRLVHELGVRAMTAGSATADAHD
jgi:uncharacterized membrane protein